MAATVAAMRRYCDSIDGRHEDPRRPNVIFVWDALERAGLAKGMQGQPYCAGGIVLTDHKVGGPQLPVTSPFYVPSRVAYARAHGLWDDSGHYEPGDELVMAFSMQAIASGLGEHVERVFHDDASLVHTFGFNTSSGERGSQDNGGGCYYRDRPHGPTVLGAVKYSQLLTRAKAPRHKRRLNPWVEALRDPKLRLPVVAGDRGDAVRAVQWAVGVPVDGVFGAATRHGVAHFQRYHHDPVGHQLVPDGEAGRLTLPALLRVSHFEH